MLGVRKTFGICAVNNFIYIGGGYDHRNVNTDGVDRYDILNDNWENLENCKLPFPVNSLTFVPVRNNDW